MAQDMGVSPGRTKGGLGKSVRRASEAAVREIVEDLPDRVSNVAA